jgi:hypothetical protein
VRINDTRIGQIEKQCYNGDISSEKALELVVEEIKRSNKALKKILNESVKVSNKQFLQDRLLEAQNYN